MSENDFECLASTGVNTPPMAKMTDHEQTGSNSAVYVLECIGGADIANLERASALSAQCFGV